MCRVGYRSISMSSLSHRKDRRSKVGSAYGNPGRVSFPPTSSTVRHRSNYQAAAAVRVSANSRMLNGNSKSLSGTEMTQVSSCSESNGVDGQQLVNEVEVDTSAAARSPVVRFSTPGYGSSETESEKNNPAFDDVIREGESVVEIKRGRRKFSIDHHYLYQLLFTNCLSPWWLHDGHEWMCTWCRVVFFEIAPPSSWCGTAQSYWLSTVDSHFLALQPIHGQITRRYSQYCAVAFCYMCTSVNCYIGLYPAWAW